jgi:hypothetical protein
MLPLLLGRCGAQDVQAMLSAAEGMLVDSAKRLNLGVQLVRKPRSVGIVPTTPTIYEVRALVTGRNECGSYETMMLGVNYFYMERQ